MNMREELRTAILSVGNQESTFETYCPHVEDFVAFTRGRRGNLVTRYDCTVDDVYRWRDYMAASQHFAPSRCNQAIAAVKFFFLHVVGKPLEEHPGRPLRVHQPKRARRRVVGRPDLLNFFDCLRFRDQLIAHMQYAGVMRLSDVVQLRLKDLNFDDQQIELATTKHHHFRIVPFPTSLHDAVRRQIESVKTIHRFDEWENPNGVPIDYAYDRKAKSSPRDLRWYWLFPSDTLSTDPKDGRLKRNHIHKGTIRTNFSKAVKKSGMLRRMTAHDLRRIAATHLHLDGMPLTKLQGILGHNSIEQTRQYIMDAESDLSGADSPFDRLMQSKR